ncbi:hypothetical protein DQ04_14801010 [Trypanosoma grayi]|uniref:hypothetical protein n=1 Tax=Trypanosoma grayi TaxID=71804 RepID=UPI0004F43B06|nr:hypothetical protein DQ04_14801010 [Trypanosoma grayi]KEG06292.1 hypothetical protein DQ04_14801010 [Trypanosoma grayi]
MSGLARGTQAVNELQVFLRAISEAQRRWAKRIAAQEAKVRRFMILEDNCRKKLRKSVLRSTNEQLKYLVSTDPLGSMEVKLPPRSAFGAFHIPMEQVNGFSVFAMARLHASPASLSGASQMAVIADLLAAWEMLPPSKKEQFEAYVESLKCGNTIEHSTSSGDCLQTSEASRKKDDIVGDGEGGTKDAIAWEAHAYSNFICKGKRQLEASIGTVDEHDWLAIAPKEWASLTLRQKRCYLPE